MKKINNLLLEAKKLMDYERFEEAESVLQKIVIMDNHNDKAHFALALCLEKREDFKNSLKHISQAVQLNKTNIEYLILYAELLNSFDSYELAIQQLEKALKIDPYNAYILDLYSSIQNNIGNYQLAKDIYKTALSSPYIQEQSSEKKIREEICVIFRYHKANQYSFSALLGAVYSNKDLEDLNILFSNNIFETTDIALSKYSKVIVCFSAMTSQMTWIALEIIKLKRLFSNICVIVGGAHATACPEDVLCLGADIAVIGGAEKAFPELLLCLQNNSTYDHIDGIAYLQGNEIKKNKPVICDINKYSPYNPKYHLYSPIEIQRGCFYSCKYCQTGSFKKVIHRSEENILEYCKFALNNNFTDIRFISPDAFAYGKKHPRDNNTDIIKSLLDKIDSLNGRKRIFFGSFPSEVRPDSITNDLLETVKDFIADKEIHLGMQAATDRMLKNIRRGHSVKDVRDSIDILLKHDFKPVVHMILSLPGETVEDRKASINEIIRFSKIGVKVRVHTFMPLPGTSFQNEPSGSIHSDIKQTLFQLASDGHVIGHFHKQDKIGEKIQDYMKRNNVFSLLPNIYFN